jgi:hypothetical protein
LVIEIFAFFFVCFEKRARRIRGRRMRRGGLKIDRVEDLGIIAGCWRGAVFVEFDEILAWIEEHRN